ncbi:hypothetical protein Cni_G18034 [Canna indica]|uniref:ROTUNDIFOLIA like 8 n=1 Tax=Canna indica TaxID=4628 RepID=A0AAQ3KNR4_9LILI|nr:hypothetical protein Cni_G18034 [Canna indica]
METMYMDQAEKWKLQSSASTTKSKGSRRRRRRSGGEEAARSFSRRCTRLVKEQRARFYIMRRCVTMLICWRDYP